MAAAEVKATRLAAVELAAQADPQAKRLQAFSVSAAQEGLRAEAVAVMVVRGARRVVQARPLAVVVQAVLVAQLAILCSLPAVGRLSPS